MAKRSGRARRWIAVVGALALVMSVQASALADGTETLGAPSIPIAAGSGIASGGVGLDAGQGQPSLTATLNVEVPAGATVNQVLLYWNGFDRESTDGGDDTITVNGTSVTGTLIGGTTEFFNQAWSSTYRADITGLGFVAAGNNALSVGGLTFTRNNNGAGIVVIYDDGTTSDIIMRDGQDLAYWGFSSPLDATVPQTYNFTPAAVDRDVTLTLFAASVRIDEDRPNAVEVTVDGTTTVFDTPFSSSDGPQFDAVELTVSVPAGVGSLTVQALSIDPNDPGPYERPGPASFAWLASGLVAQIPDDGGGDGCTPGYWRQEHHFDSWTGYLPSDSFDAVFGVTSSEGWTLEEAVWAKGGGENALARHAVAALLNAASGDVDYEFSEADVIAAVQAAYASGDFEGTKDQFEEQNELGCPLD